MVPSGSLVWAFITNSLLIRIINSINNHLLDIVVVVVFVAVDSNVYNPFMSPDAQVILTVIETLT